MGRSGRFLGLLRPYRLLFAANIAATLVASLMDGATFVLLIPFLRALFHLDALPATGSSSVEAVLGKIAGPLLSAGAPGTALRNVVLVLLIALLVKNAARSEEHTSELQSPCNLVCRLLLEKKKIKKI